MVVKHRTGERERGVEREEEGENGNGGSSARRRKVRGGKPQRTIIMPIVPLGLIIRPYNLHRIHRLFRSLSAANFDYRRTDAYLRVL